MLTNVGNTLKNIIEKGTFCLFLAKKKIFAKLDLNNNGIERKTKKN